MTEPHERGEHPLRRPFELFIGTALAIVGALIIISRRDMAPGYLADTAPAITYAYAACMVAGGLALVTGLLMLWRDWTKRTAARIVLVVGYALLALICVTYLETLVAGRLASPRSTLLIGILGAILAASLSRAYFHIKDNRATRRAQIEAVRYLDK